MQDIKTFFEETIPHHIKDKGDTLKVGAIFFFNITGEGGGQWTLDLKDDLGVHSGDQGNAECKIELSAEDWKDLINDPDSAMQLFFSGKIKIEGDPMLATKLQDVLAKLG